ncbi:hypothetical protein G7072_14555 [Nocardioides sp. HDW12B]|uniref:hypothetical protein n=1 Tax=Nocardioides sp. HDW12B TaxID=2714939 RepID=UPI00140ABAA7|nr:hypothetical protein [Nocardioides sp. HDW12B]QIK67399.1 hypothetical protein G7072_14555 [Nocardioides sp. HDW12B]
MSEAGATCDHCGVAAPEGVPPVTWTVSTERGRVLRYCDTCTRAHLRSMEGKLDREHW